MADFRQSKLGPRGSLTGAEGLKSRVKSNPNLLLASGVNVRPKFFNAHGLARNAARLSLARMKAAQLETLEKLRAWAADGAWAEVHSAHFDWWMFPIEDGRRRKFNVLRGDVAELRADAEWAARYRESVALVARAWAWDVERARPVEGAQAARGQAWTHWDVRLAKIVRSLWLFECDELMLSMQKFARTVKPHIAPSLDVPDFTRFFWRRMWVRDDYLGNPVPPFHHEDDEIVDFAAAESFMDDVSVIPSVRRRRSCSPARKKD